MTTRTLAALALLLVVALAAPTALADAPDQPLGPTQIAGDLPPPEADGTAFIKWGGATLYQLTARLAVNGCDLNLLWVYDDQTQKYTAAYTFDGPSFLNAPFERLYGDGIPPTTLWVQCIDMMQHVYGYGQLSDQERDWVDSSPKGVLFDISVVVDPLTDCGDHWKDEVRNYVLPFVPIMQNICIVQFETIGLRGGREGFSSFYLSYSVGSRFAYHPKQTAIVAYQGQAGNPLSYEGALLTEIHELCHGNQAWHTIKYVLTYDHFRAGYDGENSLLGYLQNFEYMVDFLELTGFRQRANGEWTLPTDSLFGSMQPYFTSSPIEMTAELCAAYVMTRLGVGESVASSYERYLTQEFVEWAEKHIFVLPESRLTDELRQRPALSGVVVGGGGEPMPSVTVAVCRGETWRCSEAPDLVATTGTDGTFWLRISKGSYLISFFHENRWRGYYSADGRGGLTQRPNAATVLHISEDYPELRVSLPADP